MESTKYSKVIFQFIFIALVRMGWAEDSVAYGKHTWLLYLGNLDNPNRQLLISWGWTGNCHPFQIAFMLSRYEILRLSYRYRETAIYHGRNHGWSWNSEHIACKYGEYHDNTGCAGPSEWWEYRGWLGHHLYL